MYRNDLLTQSMAADDTGKPGHAALLRAAFETQGDLAQLLATLADRAQRAAHACTELAREAGAAAQSRGPIRVPTANLIGVRSSLPEIERLCLEAAKLGECADRLNRAVNEIDGTGGTTAASSN